MAGYGGDASAIQFITGGTVVTIEGHGATLDAAYAVPDGEHCCSFFTMNVYTGSLTVRNVTMQNGRHPDGGAIGVATGHLTLDGCTLVNNTSTDDFGGAIDFSGGTTGLIKGCTFVGPISKRHNDIRRPGVYEGIRANVTFACAVGEVGTPVQAKGGDLVVIPPSELQCM
jgi:hypothetical protein